MAVIQVRVNEKGCTLTRRTEITSNPTDATVSIEGGDMCAVALGRRQRRS
jgi:hypothetical protein